MCILNEIFSCLCFNFYLHVHQRMNMDANHYSRRISLWTKQQVELGCSQGTNTFENGTYNHLTYIWCYCLRIHVETPLNFFIFCFKPTPGKFRENSKGKFCWSCEQNFVSGRLYGHFPTILLFLLFILDLIRTFIDINKIMVSPYTQRIFWHIRLVSILTCQFHANKNVWNVQPNYTKGNNNNCENSFHLLQFFPPYLCLFIVQFPKPLKGIELLIPPTWNDWYIYNCSLLWYE